VLSTSKNAPIQCCEWVSGAGEDAERIM